MKEESKGGWTTVDRNTRNQTVDDLERRRIRHQKEDERRVERIFHFQTKRQHLLKMWIVFRDPKTIFNHPDKYVFEMVGDEDIIKYQKGMGDVIGGRSHDFLQDVYFLQPFFTSKDDVDYFVRKYKPWSLHASS